MFKTNKTNKWIAFIISAFALVVFIGTLPCSAVESSKEAICFSPTLGAKHDFTTCLPNEPIPAPPVVAISPEAQQRIAQELAYPNSGFFVEGGNPYYRYECLSTGGFRIIERGNYRLDALDVYMMMNYGPIRFPLVIGVEDMKTGAYTSLVMLSDGGAPRSDFSREELLEIVPARLPRWKNFTFYLFDVVTYSGEVNWDSCTPGVFPLHCEVGQLFEDTYQAEMLLFRNLALDQYHVPNGFAIPWTLTLH